MWRKKKIILTLDDIKAKAKTNTQKHSAEVSIKEADVKIDEEAEKRRHTQLKR